MFTVLTYALAALHNLVKVCKTATCWGVERLSSQSS